MRELFVTIILIVFCRWGISQKIESNKYIFTVRIETRNSTHIHQTGFRLKNTKGILTSLHGIALGKGFVAYNEEGFILKKLTLTFVDIPNDVALLSSPELESLPADGLEKTNDKSLVKYFVLGHPAGINLYKKPVSIDPFNLKPLSRLIPPASSQAFLNRHSPDVAIKIIDINSGNLVPGNSGSPLVDERNRVLGIVGGGILKGIAGISWATPIENLKLIEVSKVKQKLYELANLPTTDLFAFEESDTSGNPIRDRIIEKEPINYINTSPSKNDIAILILDNNNRPMNSISSEIAMLYLSKGYSVTTSLFTNSFLNSNYLQEIQTVNSNLIDKLELASHVKYVVIGKYSNDFEEGTRTKWISRAKLDITIISCVSKSQIDGFEIDGTNGYDDKLNAQKGAIEKMLKKYLNTAHINSQL